VRPRTSSPYLRIGLLVLITTIAVGLVTLLRGLDDGEFILLVVLFAAGSLAFVGAQGQFSSRKIFEIPCFLTIAFFVEFGLVPTIRYLGVDPYFGSYPTVDERALIRSLLYLIAGMIGFWGGCLCLRRKKGRRESPLLTEQGRSDSPSRGYILVFATLLWAISFSAKLYMLKLHIYFYLGSLDTYFSNLAFAQVLGVLAPLGEFALIVIAMESFSGPFDPKVNFYFWSIFTSECVWGLMSGMKGQLLLNFLLVGVVVSFLRPQIAKRWIIGFVVGLILIYPLFDEYRTLTRGPFSIEIGSASEALRTQQVALFEAAERTDGSSGWVAAGVQSTLARLDLLESVGTVVSLGSETSKLQGDERWWMIPFYPFVPRFIWSSKPILDKGSRFSEILGYGHNTSTAVTYPGDLYLTLGLPGILIGMFLLGAVAQRVTNIVSCDFKKRDLFVYAAIFLSCTNIEADAFSFWSGFIRVAAIISAIAWIVYGPSGQLIGLARREKSSTAGRELRGVFESHQGA
jgi:hypothetical protein